MSDAKEMMEALGINESTKGFFLDDNGHIITPAKRQLQADVISLSRKRG